MIANTNKLLLANKKYKGKPYSHDKGDVNMELINAILEELKLRDSDKRGKMYNLSTLELICLAYSLGVKV